MKVGRFIFMLIGTPLLTSCYIGPGGICGPQTPIAYCQSKEELDRLLHPKPYGVHWIKEGMKQEQRRMDSWACGAAKTSHAADHVVFGKEQLQREKHPDDEDDFASRTRLRLHRNFVPF